MNFVRTIAAFVFALAFVCQPALASAFVAASPESRVGAFEDVQAAFVGGIGDASGEQHKGIGEAYDEIASGYRFAAGGAKQTGSYTNTHASGKTYSGKGSRARSQQSGRRQARANDDPHTATDWTPAENSREAFKQESRRIDAQGGVDSPSNYNKVESPGRRFRVEDREL